MYELFLFIVHHAWKLRRNAFIATGGLAVLLFAVWLRLSEIPGTPPRLVNFVARAMMVMVTVVIVAMAYYVLRFIVRWVMWALRELDVIHEKPRSRKENWTPPGI